VGRKKLDRFKDNAASYNVVQDGKPNFGKLQGKWGTAHFSSKQELVLELGCGNGEYTVGLGEKYPEKNFVGVDIKGSRIWIGSSYAFRENLQNVAFLRTQIASIDQHFGLGEIDEVWITFPDPRPRDRDEKRRLTSPKYMSIYNDLLKRDGWVKFKTDNTDLFNYTLSLFESTIAVKNLVHTHDLYKSVFMGEHHGVKTKYERLFYAQGETIKYLKFQFAYS